MFENWTLNTFDPPLPLIDSSGGNMTKIKPILLGGKYQSLYNFGILVLALWAILIICLMQDFWCCCLKPFCGSGDTNSNPLGITSFFYENIERTAAMSAEFRRNSKRHSHRYSIISLSKMRPRMYSVARSSIEECLEV